MSEKTVVFITGVSSGIGLETASLLHQKGFRVIGSSRHPEKLTPLPFPVFSLDITSEESICTCVHRIKSEFGQLNVLICNAGIMGPVAAGEELTPEVLWKVFQTNFFGTVNLIRCVTPLMRTQKGGRIIVLSSIAGKIGAPPFFSAYAASKHALEGYVETIAKELAPFQIHVTLVEPGYFHTAIDQSIQTPPTPISEYQTRRHFTHALQQYAIEHGRHPQQVAYAILNTLQKPYPPLRVVVGLDAKFLDTGRRYLPDKLFQFFLSQMFSWKKETQNPVTPIRKFLMNSKIADCSWHILSIGFLTFGLVQLVKHIYKKDT